MEMEKAYDPKALVESLKAQGIEEGGKVAKIVVSSLADWLRSSMKLSTGGIVGHLDDLAIPVVNTFEKVALAKIDEFLVPAPAAPEAPVAEAPAPEAVPAEPAAPAASSEPAPGV